MSEGPGAVPPTSATALRETALRLAAGARLARDWVAVAGAEATSVANEAPSLRAEALRVEGLARRIARSATRRMCVGVYGASQQGKSYLVSVLARPPGKNDLRVRFGGTTYDFVRDLNPAGGRESTGLVTRFTTAAPTLVEPDFPVELVLLNELDLVKIFANSFQSDFDQNNLKLVPPRGDDVRVVLNAAAGGRGGPQPARHLDLLAISELSEYMRRNFQVRWNQLEPLNYWERLAELAPGLSLDGRAALFAVLWGGLPEFTELFRLLAGALERLGHPETAVTEMKALVPRGTSIIEVAALHRLLEASASEDRLVVRARREGGLAAPETLPRAVVAALVAELRVTMEERPWPMFEHTDLLDFPGARSRLKLTELPEAAAERLPQARELLLRGKIAYLFQRYAEEHELTAMLLCMGNKPNEVKDLGALVRQWVEATHGATPQARRAVAGALFVVLTMMDLEFLPKAGETPDAIQEKWDIRLHTSLVEPFQNDGWLRDFAGCPFDATVMLRNPNFRQDHLMEYRRDPVTEQPSQPLVETASSRQNRLYIDELRSAFIRSVEVARHVADPERAWNAIFALNDGGVGYIVERLAGVSDPSLKLIQAEARLRDGVLPLYEGLRRFHHGADEAARRDKEALLRASRTGLQKAFYPRKVRAFPRFVARLMVEQTELREIALTVAAMDVEKSFAATAEAVELEEDDPFGAAPAPAPKPAVRLDRSTLFAREVQRHWIGQLRRLAQQEAVLTHFELPSRVAVDVADQLVIAANRLAVIERMAASIRAATDLAAVRWEDMADRIVMIAASELNGFVAELGFDRYPVEKRPGVPEGAATPQRRVFELPPTPAMGELPELGAEPEPLPRQRFIDWGVAFLQLGLDNLDHEGGRELSAPRNAALGDILRQLVLA